VEVREVEARNRTWNPGWVLLWTTNRHDPAVLNSKPTILKHLTDGSGQDIGKWIDGSLPRSICRRERIPADLFKMI
jgi:hypothetical protein